MCQKISKTTVQCQEYLTALLQTVAHEKFTFCPSAPALADEAAAFITDATKVHIRTRLKSPNIWFKCDDPIKSV